MNDIHDVGISTTLRNLAAKAAHRHDSAADERYYDLLLERLFWLRAVATIRAMETDVKDVKL